MMRSQGGGDAQGTDGWQHRSTNEGVCAPQDYPKEHDKESELNTGKKSCIGAALTFERIGKRFLKIMQIIQKKITNISDYNKRKNDETLFFTTKCKRFPKSINIIPTVQRHS